MIRDILFLLFINLIWLASCTECDPGYLVDGSGLSLEVVDATTDEDYFSQNPVQSFQVWNEFREEIEVPERYFFYHSVVEKYVIRLDPTRNQRIDYNIENKRRFFLVFDSLDVDTLNLSFIPREDRCNEYMDEFKVYYNGELMFEG